MEIEEETSLSRHESTLIVIVVLSLLAGFFGVAILQKIKETHLQIIATMAHEQASYLNQIKRQAKDIQKLKLDIKSLRSKFREQPTTWGDQ